MPSLVWQMYVPLSDTWTRLMYSTPVFRSTYVLSNGKYPSTLVQFTGRTLWVMRLLASQVKFTWPPTFSILIVGLEIVTVTVDSDSDGRFVVVCCTCGSPSIRKKTLFILLSYFLIVKFLYWMQLKLLRFSVSLNRL